MVAHREDVLLVHHVLHLGEMWGDMGRYGGDMGEIRARYGRDKGRYRGDTGEIGSTCLRAMICPLRMHLSAYGVLVGLCSTSLTLPKYVSK